MKTYKPIKLKRKSSAPTVILLTTICMFIALAWQSKDYKPTHKAPQVAPTSEVKPITLYRKGKASQRTAKEQRAINNFKYWAEFADVSELKPKKDSTLSPMTPKGERDLAAFKKTLYKDNHMTPAQRKKAYNALFAKE